MQCEHNGSSQTQIVYTHLEEVSCASSLTKDIKMGIIILKILYLYYYPYSSLKRCGKSNS